MSTRPTILLAWGLFGTFVAVLLAALGVIVLGPGTGEDAFVFFIVGYAFVGTLIASRLPGNAVGWLLLAIGLVLAIGALLDASLRSPDAPLLELSAWLSAWSFYVWLTIAAVFLPLVYPDGRLVSPRWRPVLWLGGLSLAFSVLGQALKPGIIDTDSAVPVQNPVGLGGAAADAVSFIGTAGNVLAGLAFLLAAASVVVRFRRSRDIERQQLKWFAYAGLLTCGGLVLAMAQVLFGAQPGDPAAEGGALEVVGSIGWFTALTAVVIGIPVAAGFAILRHRLYDIDVVIRRTLVYGALTAALVATYVGGVLLLQLLLSPLTPESDLAIAGSTLAVAAAFGPLRVRIQTVVDRRFYRRRFDAAHTVESFSARLRDEVELGAVEGELRAVTAATMQPAHLSLWLRPEGPR
jgi:hypothetical protein